MAEQMCVCPQCGKKYKLKEGFDAKSFSCKGCGATVWVTGKAPAPAPTPRRSGASAKAAPSRRAGRAAAAKPGRGGRRSREREPAEHEEEGGRRGRGREKKKSSANLLMAIGAVAVIGIVIVIAVMSGKKDKGGTTPTPVATQPGDESGGTGMSTTGSGTPGTPTGTTPESATPDQTATPGDAGATPTQPAEEGAKPDEGDQGKEGDEGDESPSPEGGEKQTTLGGNGKKPADGLGKWDPPATLGHLDSTPPEQRKQIDELVAVLLDPDAGREVQEAKAKLAAIGKPAFLPVLGKMAAIRDSISDTDTLEERKIESSLMLGDQCLREMDGFLDASGKQIIRPGTDKKYIKYILVLHYRRWLGGMPPGAQGLKDMAEMPGPFDPSKAPPSPDEEGDK